TLFAGTSVSANKDAMLNDLQNLGQYAYQYKLRPEQVGGGGLTYSGFSLPPNLSSNENATYAVSVSAGAVTITGTSKYGYGSISAVVDSTGRLGNHVYSGEFN